MKTSRLNVLMLICSLVWIMQGEVRGQECDPVEVQKLLASDGFAGGLSHALAVEGNTAVIGSVLHDHYQNGNESGAAYVFKWDGTAWVEIFELRASDGQNQDWFGTSVALSGTTAIIGADGDGRARGAAYLFDVTSGLQIQKLVAPDGEDGDQFGTSVGISEKAAIVGVLYHTHNGRGSGAVYVFDVTTGELLRELRSEDPDVLKFGSSVGISGTTAIASDGSTSTDGSSAWLFDVTTGELLHILVPNDPGPFGGAVAIDGNLVIVGTATVWGGEGAYLFDVTTGEQIHKLVRADGQSSGRGVAINGDLALVGALMDNDRTGAAFLYNVITGEEIARLDPSDGEAGSSFSAAVAIIGDTAFCSGGRGAAYVFDLNCGETPSLRAIGTCPGRMGFEVTSATPNKQIAYLYAFGQGTIKIHNGYPCPGTTLGLNATAKLATIQRADANGTATFITKVPAKACGRVFMQALDISTCATTNVVLVN